MKNPTPTSSGASRICTIWAFFAADKIGEGGQIWGCRDEAGDVRDDTAVTSRKLMVSLVVGKRTKDQTHELVKDAESRLRLGHIPVLLSDGYEGYEPAILDAFGHRYPTAKSGLKGRPRIQPFAAQGLAYGQVIKSASDGMHLKVIRGKAQLQHTLSLLGYNKINTSVVERHNGTSRLHNQRKVMSQD